MSKAMPTNRFRLTTLKKVYINYEANESKKRIQIEMFKVFAEEIGKGLQYEKKDTSCKKILSILTTPSNKISLIKGMNAFKAHSKYKKRKRILERIVNLYFSIKCKKLITELKKSINHKKYSKPSFSGTILLKTTSACTLASPPNTQSISDIMIKTRSAIIIQRFYRKIQFNRWLKKSNATTQDGRICFVESKGCLIV